MYTSEESVASIISAITGRNKVQHTNTIFWPDHATPLKSFKPSSVLTTPVISQHPGWAYKMGHSRGVNISSED